jgi:RNA polymerase sigma-70 factor (ECF subfamily)
LNDGQDKSVVDACDQGERTTFATLVETHYRHVFALCLGMLANVHDAQDVAQETMLKGLTNIRNLAKPEQFESWILRIAKNLCIDLLRRRKRIKAIPAELEPVSAPPVREHNNLEEAVRRLPQELRLPLVLFYFENRDAGSVAGRLGISQSLVYERLRAAREQLHTLLIERGTHE